VAHYTLTVSELIRLLAGWSPDTPVLIETPEHIVSIGTTHRYDGMNLRLQGYERT